MHICGVVVQPVVEMLDIKIQNLLGFLKQIGFKMEYKYCIITKDNTMRLFYKGVEIEHFRAWEARYPDFHHITFTVDGDYVEFHIDKDQVSEQTTEEFLVEQILQKDEEIKELKKQNNILRMIVNKNQTNS